MYSRFLRHRHTHPEQSRARSPCPDLLRHINHATARYGLHQPVRILLLSLHVDRLNLGKVHYSTSYIQSHANGNPITRRLHRIHLRRSLETVCKRLLCVSRIIFSSRGPELRGTNSLILPPDRQSEHTISGPRCCPREFPLCLNE